jgi:hypothetical protein
MNAEQREMIPLRALNQVSYCHRLYYLEHDARDVVILS